jgi:hypothetical protein
MSRKLVRRLRPPSVLSPTLTTNYYYYADCFDSAKAPDPIPPNAHMGTYTDIHYTECPLN